MDHTDHQSPIYPTADPTTTRPTSRSDILSKAKGQFTSELKEMLYAHGDPQNIHDPMTVEILEDIILEFLYDTCTHANRLTGSKSRLRMEDLKFVFRHDPILLGRIEEIIQKEKQMASARKLADDGQDLTGLAHLGTSSHNNVHDDEFDRLLASITGSELVAPGTLMSPTPHQLSPSPSAAAFQPPATNHISTASSPGLSADDSGAEDSVVLNPHVIVDPALASILGHFH